MLEFKNNPRVPHEYAVKNKGNKGEFLNLFEKIGKSGVWEPYGRGVYKYLYLDGYKYWAMTLDKAKIQLINRIKI